MKEPVIAPELGLSNVLPVYNESGNLETFIPERYGVLRDLGCSYEIIAVDDGSTDSSVAMLHRLKKQERTCFAIQHKSSPMICADDQRTFW